MKRTIYLFVSINIVMNSNQIILLQSALFICEEEAGYAAIIMLT